jgi:hypothetical protein
LGNYQYFDADTTTASEIKGFSLTKLREGTYLTIACKRTATGGNPSTFLSEFKTTAYPNTTLTGAAQTIHYATGLTYDMGLIQNNLDVFYVSVLNLTRNANGVATSIDLLVNHQRYHA